MLTKKTAQREITRGHTFTSASRVETHPTISPPYTYVKQGLETLHAYTKQELSPPAICPLFTSQACQKPSIPLYRLWQPFLILAFNLTSTIRHKPRPPSPLRIISQVLVPPSKPAQLSLFPLKMKIFLSLSWTPAPHLTAIACPSSQPASPKQPPKKPTPCEPRY